MYRRDRDVRIDSEQTKGERIPILKSRALMTSGSVGGCPTPSLSIHEPSFKRIAS